MRKKLWSRWLQIAEVIGNIQLTILLTIIYWVLVPLIAVPFKFLADPLLKRVPLIMSGESLVIFCFVCRNFRVEK